MRKLILFASLVAVGTAQAAETLVFSNQVITVRESNLSLESVRYAPESIVTNTVQEWVTYTAYYTNNFHNPPLITIDEEASRQVETTTITTNAAAWTAIVKFDLPRGYQWQLNGLPVTINRFSTTLDIHLDPATVQGVFGASYPGLLFAASTGDYQPTGQVRDGVLMLGAQALAEGIGQ